MIDSSVFVLGAACSAKQVEEAQAAIAKAEAEKEALVAEAEASKAELARQNEEWKASLSAAEAQKAEELAARTEALKQEFELEAKKMLCMRTLKRIKNTEQNRAFRAWSQFWLRCVAVGVGAWDEKEHNARDDPCCDCLLSAARSRRKRRRPPSPLRMPFCERRPLPACASTRAG